MSYPNERDCEHGSLKRSCQICELQRDYNEIQQINDALQSKVYRMKKYLEGLYWSMSQLEHDEEQEQLQDLKALIDESPEQSIHMVKANAVRDVAAVIDGDVVAKLNRLTFGSSGAVTSGWLREYADRLEKGTEQ